MSEELKVVEGENTPETSSGEVQYSEIEKRAMEQGWRPKDQWDGEPDEWRSAREFVDRGELLTRVSSQSSEIKELKKALGFLNEHHRKVKETEFNRALSHLKSIKKEALESGDADKVVEADEAIRDLKDQQRDSQNTPVESPAAPHPEFVRFVERNSWYTTDPDKKEFADTIGFGLKTRKPDIDPVTLFKYVEDQVKKAFPDVKKPTAPAVEGGSAGGGSRSSNKEYPLTDDEKRVMRSFVSQGIMTKEEYIAELKAVKGEK